MKTWFTMSFLIFFSAIASAQNCVEALMQGLEQDPNIRLVKVTNVYNCGPHACAVTYKHDDRPHPDLNVLAFLDNDYGFRVDWAPFHSSEAYGSQVLGRSKKVVYISTPTPAQKQMTVDLSVETPRDDIFFPNRHTYYKTQYSCVR